MSTNFLPLVQLIVLESKVTVEQSLYMLAHWLSSKVTWHVLVSNGLSICLDATTHSRPNMLVGFWIWSWMWSQAWSIGQQTQKGKGKTRKGHHTQRGEPGKSPYHLPSKKKDKILLRRDLPCERTQHGKGRLDNHINLPTSSLLSTFSKRELILSFFTWLLTIYFSMYPSMQENYVVRGLNNNKISLN